MTNPLFILEKFILDRKHGELLIILLTVADVVSFLFVIKRKKRCREFLPVAQLDRASAF